MQFHLSACWNRTYKFNIATCYVDYDASMISSSEGGEYQFNAFLIIKKFFNKYGIIPTGRC